MIYVDTWSMLRLRSGTMAAQLQAEVCPNRANSERHRPNLAETESTFPGVWPNTLSFGRSFETCAQRVDVIDRTRAIWHDTGKFGPNMADLAKFGLESTKFGGPTSTTFDQTWHEIGPMCLGAAKIGPNSDNFGFDQA